VFCDDFEGGALSKWPDIPKQGGADVLITQDQSFSGSNAAKLIVPATQGGRVTAQLRTVISDNRRRGILSARFRHDGWPANAPSELLAVYFQPNPVTGFASAQIQITKDANIKLYRRTVQGDGGPEKRTPVEAGTWTYLELLFNHDQGTAQLRINGNVVAEEGGLTFGASEGDRAISIRAGFDGNDGTPATQAWLDDVKLILE
jgi:hypothetical protein